MNSFFKNIRGFTLIEVMVSLTIFSIVVVMAVGAIFSLVDSGEKARSLNSVMENLNVALETMSRTIREGDSASYGSVGNGDVLSGETNPVSCTYTTSPQPADNIYFKIAADGLLSVNIPTTGSVSPGATVEGITYGLSPASSIEYPNQIVELVHYSDGTVSSPIPVTASEVYVQSLTFWIYNCLGSNAEEEEESQPERPYVVMSVSGYAETRQGSKVNFSIQTTMTGR